MNQAQQKFIAALAADLAGQETYNTTHQDSGSNYFWLAFDGGLNDETIIAEELAERWADDPAAVAALAWLGDAGDLSGQLESFAEAVPDHAYGSNVEFPGGLYLEFFQLGEQEIQVDLLIVFKDAFGRDATEEDETWIRATLQAHANQELDFVVEPRVGRDLTAVFFYGGDYDAGWEVGLTAENLDEFKTHIKEEYAATQETEPSPHRTSADALAEAARVQNELKR